MSVIRGTTMYERMKAAGARQTSANPLAPKKKSASKVTRTDAILSIADQYMAQMVRGEKTYEFRTFKLKDEIKRIWFYTTAPVSSIRYICEIGPARLRGDGHDPLPEEGLGNKEFNEFHPDWDRHDYAYPILSVYEISIPVSLSMMKAEYGMKAAPQSLVYVPDKMRESVEWNLQKKILPPSSE